MEHSKGALHELYHERPGNSKKGDIIMETQTQIPFTDEDLQAIAPDEQGKRVSVLDSAEDILLKLEYLEGLTRVCASAFGSSNALANVNERDLENVFYSIREQVVSLEERTHGIINAILSHNAKLNY